MLDSTGGRIAQASIVVVNLATGMRYAMTSDTEGGFAIDQLLPGDYSARAEAQGMSPQVTPPLHVDVGGISHLEFRLSVASAQETLTVSAAPTSVETQPSAVSALLDERAVNDFPLNGRRFSDLAMFSPGVTQDPRSLTSATNGDLSFGGIRGFQNTFFLSTAATTTMRSSPRLAAVIVLLINSRPRSCRNSGYLPTPTARNRAGQGEPS